MLFFPNKQTNRLLKKGKKKIKNWTPSHNEETLTGMTSDFAAKKVKVKVSKKVASSLTSKYICELSSQLTKKPEKQI